MSSRDKLKRHIVKFDKNEKDPFKILGVDYDSSTQEIKRAFKKLAKEWHPDKNDSPDAEEIFKMINNAYKKVLKVKMGEGIWKFPKTIPPDVLNIWWSGHEHQHGDSIVTEVEIDLDPKDYIHIKVEEDLYYWGEIFSNPMNPGNEGFMTVYVCDHRDDLFDAGNAKKSATFEWSGRTWKLKGVNK